MYWENIKQLVCICVQMYNIHNICIHGCINVLGIMHSYIRVTTLKSVVLLQDYCNQLCDGLLSESQEYRFCYGIHN